MIDCVINSQFAHACIILNLLIKTLHYHWQIPFCKAVLISCRVAVDMCNVVIDGVSQREIKQSVMSRLWGGLPSLIRFHCYTACPSRSVLSNLRLFPAVIVDNCAAFVICNEDRGS